MLSSLGLQSEVLRGCNRCVTFGTSVLGECGREIHGSRGRSIEGKLGVRGRGGGRGELRGRFGLIVQEGENVVRFGRVIGDGHIESVLSRVGEIEREGMRRVEEGGEREESRI